MAEKREKEAWRIWVDPQRRLVSFHEAEGGTLMEFFSHEMFLKCVDQYAGRGFRFQ